PGVSLQGDEKSICKILWTISDPKRQSVSAGGWAHSLADASGYFFQQPASASSTAVTRVFTKIESIHLPDFGNC
ncbi:MAG: hypothetical protein KDB03_27455, partial [Planctomycetales bacterium]|nr:hypothetical protein [Planctomycetales bacterium]